MRSFADPQTHFAIVPSESPVTVDGYAKGEPKFLECDECDARVLIDGPDGHTTTVDDIPHSRTCAQRDVVSQYYIEKYVE